MSNALVTCSRCAGCGRVADSADGEPWSAWENLQLRSAGVDRTARVANLPEERAAVAAWRAARGEGGQGHIWRNGDA